MWEGTTTSRVLGGALLDVSRSGRGEQPWVVRGEAHSVHLLGKRLAAQHHRLLRPVPQRQHVVRGGAQAGEQAAVGVELHEAVRPLRATSTQTEALEPNRQILENFF